MIDFKDIRIPWHLPPYPPYHTGKYLEEYFYDFYRNRKDEFDRLNITLIPVFWTTAYLKNINVQRYIDYLPCDKKYFAVSQHDDAIKERLPEGTIVFSAGGNSGGIPIPLVCSPIPSKYLISKQKDIFCSFIGSNTHPLRKYISDLLKEDKNYYIKIKHWTDDVRDDEMSLFLDVTSRSKFTLCPRGYGAQSFRLYEAIQLNSVPVYIFDTPWLPFDGIIKWSDFCVLIDRNNIHNIKSILESITPEQYDKMLAKGKEAYTNFFTLQATCETIYKLLKQKKYE